MTPLLTKYALTALIIVAVSEIAKRNDKWGALISALPLVTLIVMIWLHLENQGDQKIANHALYTFWYVLPTLPMFLLMPRLMTRGVNFWLAILLCALLTVLCFTITAVIARRFGVELLP